MNFKERSRRGKKTAATSIGRIITAEALFCGHWASKKKKNVKLEGKEEEPEEEEEEEEEFGFLTTKYIKT